MPDTFIVGFAAVVLVALVLLLETQRALYRRNLARTLFVGGLGFTVLGVALVLVHYGVSAAANMAGHTAVYTYIGWIGFFPDWIRLACFIVAIVMFVAAVAVRLLAVVGKFVGLFGGRERPTRKPKPRVRSAAARKPAPLRNIREKSDHKPKPETAAGDKKEPAPAESEPNDRRHAG